MQNRDAPLILYKYRNWQEENHKNVLLKNQLYFTSPQEFNDPFDCRIAPNLSVLDTIEKARAFAIKCSNENIFINENQIEEFAKSILNDPKEKQIKYDDLNFKAKSEYYGVLSLSKTWKSILMWSHYAKCHEGFCVGLWLDKLHDLNKFSHSLVEYPLNDNYPIISPLNDFDIIDFFIESHTKSKEWMYEEEYRFLQIFYPEIPISEDRILTIPDEFIAEVIIGMNASENTENQILQIAKEKNIKIYKTEREPSKFQIIRREIKFS